MELDIDPLPVHHLLSLSFSLSQTFNNIHTMYMKYQSCVYGQYVVAAAVADLNYFGTYVSDNLALIKFN